MTLEVLCLFCRCERVRKSKMSKQPAPSQGKTHSVGNRLT